MKDMLYNETINVAYFCIILHIFVNLFIKKKINKGIDFLPQTQMFLSLYL